MQKTPNNPYQDFYVVRNKDMFFGRIALLRRLCSAVESRQCISLVGSRHIGKSSILRYIGFPEVQRQSGYDLQTHIFVPLDLRMYRQRTSECFLEAVIEHIAVHWKHLDLVFGSRKGPDEFSFMLKQIADKGLHLVLLMD